MTYHYHLNPPFPSTFQALLFGQLLDKVLVARSARSYDAPSLEMCAKLLELNPEVYTAWNYRREAYQETITHGGNESLQLVQNELQLTEKALMRNPKSYATWHHRKWILSFGFSSLEHEMLLVEKLLDADERNFHGWGYRRFIAQRMGMPVEKELEYTKRKIEQNFSNYSAWHYRSSLLPLLFHSSNTSNTTDTHDEPAIVVSSGSASTAELPYNVLDSEFQFVRQALYTEPDDQSGWFYHRWLLGCAVASYNKSIIGTLVDDETILATKHDEEVPSTSKQEVLQLLHNEQSMCGELLVVEGGDSKWALLTLARLERTIREILGTAGGVDDADSKGYYEKLACIDGMRQGFYEDAKKGHVVLL